ncbi:MAG: LEPR-XLL domain-containing protein, partial [Planctomycetota bacterium]
MSNRFAFGHGEHAVFEPLEQRVLLSGDPIVVNTYHNLDSVALSDVPVTFSRVGADGDFDVGITPRIGGVELPAQVDVLRTADDGSIRHALVSFVLPDLAANGDVRIEWLNQQPAAPAAFTWGFDTVDFNMVLELDKADGGTLTSDA